MIIDRDANNLNIKIGSIVQANEHAPAAHRWCCGIVTDKGTYGVSIIIPLPCTATGARYERATLRWSEADYIGASLETDLTNERNEAEGNP